MNSVDDQKALLQQGFSLLEVLVVLTVMGLVASLSIPAIRSAHRSDPRSFAEKILIEAKLARLRALNQGRDVIMDINLDRRLIVFNDRAHEITIPDEFALSAVVGRDEGTTASSGRITFMPDGGSTGGKIIIRGKTGRTASIRVNWLTGAIVEEADAR